MSQKLGSPMTIDAGGVNVNGQWNGHAREETLTKWTSQGWKEAILPGVKSYTEGRGIKETQFTVPLNKVIKVIYNPKVITPSGTHPFQIVTREANNDEAKIHPRFPRLVDNNGT